MAMITLFILFNKDYNTHHKHVWWCKEMRKCMKQKYSDPDHLGPRSPTRPSGKMCTFRWDGHYLKCPVGWDRLFGFRTPTKKNLHSCLHLNKSGCPDQFCFVLKLLLLYWTSTTSCIGYENQMLQCDTSHRWGGNQQDQGSIRKCIPSRNTAVSWDMKFHMAQKHSYVYCIQDLNWKI